MLATLARRTTADDVGPLDPEQLQRWADDEAALMALLTDD